MKREKEVLTNKMLDEIYQKLNEEGGRLQRDENGRPVYTLSFHGTKKEAEAIRQKLLELEPHTKQT